MQITIKSSTFAQIWAIGKAEVEKKLQPAEKTIVEQKKDIRLLYNIYAKVQALSFSFGRWHRFRR